MPRHLTEPHKRLEVQIPLSLALKVELFLKRDGITGKVAYGEWSKLTERLFNRFLDDMARPAHANEEPSTVPTQEVQ